MLTPSRILAAFLNKVVSLAVLLEPGEELTAQLDTGIQSYDNVETENGRL